MLKFKNMLKEELEKNLPESMIKNAEVSYCDVVKINDQELHGITLKPKNQKGFICPTVYIENFYKEYCNGKPKEEIVNELIDIFTAEIPEGLNLEEVKDRIKQKDLKGQTTFRLVEIKRNTKFLKDRPYKDVGCGLALICDYRVANNENMVACITNDFLQNEMGMNEEELFETTFQNNAEEAKLYEMYQMLMTGEEKNLFLKNLFLDDNPIPVSEIDAMYTLTNNSQLFGASALFYPGVMERIAKKLGNYYVLPSSLHEVIILPSQVTSNKAEELKGIVFNANRTVVESCDVLSDNVYCFTEETGLRIL